MSGWDAILAELERKRAFARSMGGEERIARHRDAGKLTARERIAALFDDGLFTEIGALAANASEGGDHPAPADGLIAGFGHVGGAPALTLIEDYTVLAGSIGDAGAAKRLRIIDLAAQERLPLVIMLEGAGHRLTNSHATTAPNDLQALADLWGRVPIVTLVMGPSAGHGALAAPLADFVVMTEAASLFVAGPPIVESAMGEKVSKEELGGPDVHCAQSGVAHNRVASDAEAIALARRYLDFASQNSTQDVATGDPMAAILDLIDPDPRIPFDARRLLELISDPGELLEIQPDYGGSLVTALARLGGRAVAILVNNPAVRAGAIDAAAAQKAAQFIAVADARGLPLVFLTDNPGVMPGKASERAGMLRHAATMFRAQRAATVPKLHVTLRKAFGFGSSVMAMNPFDRQTISLAFPAISLGAMPADAGSRSARLSDEAAAEAARRQTGAAWELAGKMAYDDIIDPRHLRRALIEGLAMTNSSRKGSQR